MDESKYFQDPRRASGSSAVNGELFVWRGDPKAALQVYEPFLEWWKPEIYPKGLLPSMLYWGASACSEYSIYVYTGMNKEALESTSGCLLRLDTKLQSWSLVAPHSSDSPMKKNGSGMVTYKDFLIVFGGYGIQNGPIQPGSEWVKCNQTEKDEDPKIEGVTNEIHKYDLKEGEINAVMVHSFMFAYFY